MAIQFTVNGDRVQVSNPDPEQRLLDFLREDMGLTGVKEGCGVGECGACTVLIDGASRLSCLTYLPEVAGKKITTIEGLGEDGQLHPIQEEFIETGGVQCGFCTPGFIMVSVELLNTNPNPSREQIREWIEGNLCRCTGYVKIVDAIERAAQQLRESDG